MIVLSMFKQHNLIWLKVGIHRQMRPHSCHGPNWLSHANEAIGCNGKLSYSGSFGHCNWMESFLIMANPNLKTVVFRGI